MDLITLYMGLKLKNPLIVSASPLSGDLDNIRLMEDVGIAAIVHYSLFQEETQRTPEELRAYLSRFSQGFPPEPEVPSFGPQEYCEHVRKAKEAVKIPIIGSLNGYAAGEWIRVAPLIEQAGADALELNFYCIPTDPGITGEDFETDALVVFNRCYQPDMDLSTSDDLRLPLQWIALLSGQVRASLAATSGIHSAEDVVKMLLAGADVTMLCSALIKNGIRHSRSILAGLTEWMQKWGYPSLGKMRGMMSRRSYRDPEVFERANYMKALRTYGKTYR